VDQEAGDGSFKGPCPGGWPYQGSYGNLYGRIRSAAAFAPPVDGQETLTGDRAKVYVTSHDGYLHCVDLVSPNTKSGSLKLNGHTWSEPVVVLDSNKNPIVMVADSAGYMVIVDGKSCGLKEQVLVNDAADLYDGSWPLVAILCATLIPLCLIVGGVVYLLRKRCREQAESEEMVAKDRQEEQDERESQALIRDSAERMSSLSRGGSFRPQDRPNGIDEIGGYRAPGGTGAATRQAPLAAPRGAPPAGAPPRGAPPAGAPPRRAAPPPPGSKRHEF
jgi:hypothetical protein